MDLRTVVKYESVTNYLPAIARWGSIHGKSPEWKFIGPRGGERINPEFAEWLMGFPRGWTEGVSYKQRMKMLGNSVMPAHAEYALAQIFAII